MVEWSESDYSRETIARLARSGAHISMTCAQDACNVCRSQAGKIYSPSAAPRLPIRGCKNPRCRCRFVAVDPQSKLSVPELVHRGIQALKAGQKDQARQILQRAVALDSLFEQGWFWLSGVVDDRHKIDCLEKVLSINPDNERAQAGLVALRDKQRIPGDKERATGAVPPPPGQQAAPPAPQTSAALPIEIIEAREERAIIAEQWGEFLAFAAATDPQMLLMQGNAFLTKMKRLNTQALRALPQASQLDELQLQWQESESVGEALASLLHDPNHRERPDWDEMVQSLRMLAQQLLDHRNTLRTQIQNAGGQVPQ